MPNKIKDNTKAGGRDMFQTPHYATKLLLPYLKPYTMVWECASGQGRMTFTLQSQHAVWASDIDTSQIGWVPNEKWDFLNQEKDEEWMKKIDYIATNPPFSLKKQFFDKCYHYWELYKIPFALLIPADYSRWLIDAVMNKGCIKLIPTRRIDYITPTGLSGEGGHTSNFHSLWLTRGLIEQYGETTEVYVELTNEMKKDI